MLNEEEKMISELKGIGNIKTKRGHLKMNQLEMKNTVTKMHEVESTAD